MVTLVNGGAQFRQTVGYRCQLKIRSGNGVTQVEQHFGNAAHPDSSDPREMQMLSSKKHFIHVLFRLPRRLSIYLINGSSLPCYFLQDLRCSSRRVRMREVPCRL